MKRKIWLFFVLFLSLGLALYSCGGSGGTSSPPSPSPSPTPQTSQKAQATLGPLGGATVKVYHLLDNGTKVLIHTTTTSKGATLDKIGYFNSYQNELNPNDWYVYEVSGGMDYDSNDDGIKDDNASPNYGTLCLIAKGDEVQGLDEIKVTPISDMVCSAVKSQFGNPDNLTNAIQDAINNIFDNSTHKPTMEDLLTFNPVKDRNKLRKKYQKGWFNLINEIKNGAPVTSPILYKKQLTEEEGDGGIDIDNNTFYLYYTYDNDTNEDVMLNIEKMSSDNYSFDNTTIDLTEQFKGDNRTYKLTKDGFIYNGYIYLAVNTTTDTINQSCSGVYRIKLDGGSLEKFGEQCQTDDKSSYSIISMTQANNTIYYLIDNKTGGTNSYTLWKTSSPSPIFADLTGISTDTTIKVSANGTIYIIDKGLFYYDNSSKGTSLLKQILYDGSAIDAQDVSMCNSNTKLLASTNDGLYLIDADNKSVIKKFADKNIVKAAACDSNNYYYIGTDSSHRGKDRIASSSYSLHIIDKKTYQDEKTAIKFPPGTEIENMLAKDGTIYITTDSNLIIIDSYMASKIELPSSTALKSKIVGDNITDSLSLLAKSPDNSLLYITFRNGSGYFLKSLKIPSLDNGSLSISMDELPKSYTITKDGSLMFAVTDQELYKIDLQNQRYKKFILPANIDIDQYGTSILSFSPATNKLYIYTSSDNDIYSLKIPNTEYDKRDIQPLDNATFIMEMEDNVFDISVSQDGKMLSILTPGNLLLYKLSQNDNKTFLKAIGLINDNSSYDTVIGGKFLRVPETSTQPSNIKTVHYIINVERKNKNIIDNCEFKFNTTDNSSSLQCSSFKPFIYNKEDNLSVFADSSGFVAIPSGYGMNMGYLNLFAIPAEDYNQNIFSYTSLNRFILYSSDDCCDQEGFGKRQQSRKPAGSGTIIWRIKPMLLISNTLYGISYLNNRKIFYIKAANSQ